MILWLVLGAITLATVVLLLRPLLWGAMAMPPRVAYDLEVYRDQLAEVGREEARGLLTPADAHAAQREIARRLLAVAPEERPAAASAPPPKPSRVAPRWMVWGLATTMPLAALGLYFVVGNPGAPGVPFASRSQAMQSGDMPDIDVALPRLEARLKAKPDDLEGWTLLARTYGSLGRYADAVDAYGHAMTLSNNRPDVVAGYAESKVLQEGGVVSPETRKLFEDVRAKDPQSVPARYYLGLVKVQEGDAEAGVRDWLAIQADAPPDAPWLPGLHGEIERVAQEFKLDLAKLVPPGAKIVPPMAASAGTGGGTGGPAGAAPVGAGGPSDSDVAAAQNMTDEQRNQMIRTMVDRLAARLQQQPDDVDGWRRLARAYTVLGEQDKAVDALSHATQLTPKDPDLLVAYGNALLASSTPGAEPPAKAVEAMRQVLEIDAGRPEALWVVGLADAAHGDNSAAAALWGKLLAQLSPGTPQYLEVKRRLASLGAAR